MQRHGDTPEQLTFAFDECGDSYFQKGDFDRAIENYSQSIKVSPQFNTAFNNRGNAYLAKHDYDRAIQDFSEAIRIKPGYVTGRVDPLPLFDYATAYQDRGSAYAAKREYDRAIEDYNEAVRLKPDDAQAFYDRGLAYEATAKYENAIADYDKALQIDPQNAAVLCSRGGAFFRTGDYVRAMQDFDEAIRLKPDDADAFYDHGTLLNSEGHYDRAIADYNRALQIDPKNAFALYSRGIAERNKDDIAASEADQVEALEIDPNIADKVGASEVAVAQAKNESARTQSVPACDALPDGAPSAAQAPPYVDEPLWQLKNMVPELKGIKPEADERAKDREAAQAAPNKSEFILRETGAAVSGQLHRMPDLIAREEVRQPIAPQEIGGKGLDGTLIGGSSSCTLFSATPRCSVSAADSKRYETHFFTYRIVHQQNASGRDAIHEFRTDAHDRPIDDSSQKIRRPFSVGFATTWLFFSPGNLHEIHFRYLGEQRIGDYETYVLAFTQIPEYSGLDAVIESSHGTCSAPLQGVAWIDQSTFQIVQVDTDLLYPLPGIQLNQLRSVLDYGPVKIHELNRTLWLPNEVGTSWQTAYGYGEELHLYSHYELFKSTARILPNVKGSTP